MDGCYLKEIEKCGDVVIEKMVKKVQNCSKPYIK
jgi:hypothetical protein